MSTAAGEERRRAYESPRRRQQAAETRAAILSAATRLFGDRGWATTAMRDIARDAGVAVETVYSNFGSKGDLLMAAIDVAVVGDAAPVPLDQRSEFTALGRGTRAQRTRAAARLVTEIHQRTAGVNSALREAARCDDALDRLMREREAGRRANVADGLALMLGRPAPEGEVDSFWAVLDVGVYRLLTDIRGWSAEQYETWLGDTIDQLLGRGRRR